MKQMLSLVSALALLLNVSIMIPAAFAADPLEVGPHVYKLLFENDQVRVMDLRFKPGDKIAEHSHPNHFVYVLEPGTIKINYPDGTTNTVDGTAGQVIWINAETHSAENIGTSDFHAIVVELKSK